MYICPDGREVRFKRYSDRTDKYGYAHTLKVYESVDCTNCPLYDLRIKSEKQINKQIKKYEPGVF